MITQMNSYTKACLASFPDFLAKRMMPHIHRNYKNSEDDLSNEPKTILIGGFGAWHDTLEGEYFWTDIKELYADNDNPTEDQIKEVFKKHNIPID